MESPNGFVTWSDVVSGVVEAERATFYWMPRQPLRGWPGNAQRLEVRSFRAGQVHAPRHKSATIYVEYVSRGARKQRAAIQRSHPSLVIVEGWGHPDSPGGWVVDEDRSAPGQWQAFRGRWDMFAPEWLDEFDEFLRQYLGANPNVRILADFRQTAISDFESGGRLENSSHNRWRLPHDEPYPSPEDGAIGDDIDQGRPDEVVMRAIRARRGQPAFRNALRERYGDRCLVTGCPVLDALEAAHIRPYRTEADNAPDNGLLLRADLHTLFDLDLLGIEPHSLIIRLHPGATPYYAEFDGRCLERHGHTLDQTALEQRWALFRSRLEARAD
jgi:hypothetical protein